MKNQETIRKLAERAANALMGEASPAQIARVAAELAPFGALLEAAQIVLDIPADDEDCAFDAKKTLRAALSDIQKL